MPERLIALLILSSLLAACLPQPAPGTPAPWVYTDLRLVDGDEREEDLAQQPGQDLIAAYARRRPAELQFRLDLLDLANLRDADLYLAIDTGPGGSQELPLDLRTEIAWDTLLAIPASGPIQAYAPDGSQRQNLAVRVLSDLAADSIEISLDPAALQAASLDLRFQIFLAAPGSRFAIDSTPALALDGPPPPQVPVLLTFWNVLPAFTPAQALRRWDGAHTGPFGGRHGLHNLLRVARNRGFPLVLLDLKTPASLSALSTTGGTGLVRDMAEQGLLILPDSVPSLWPSPAPILTGSAWTRTVAESRERSKTYDLPDSPFLFSPFQVGFSPGEARRSYQVVFAPGFRTTTSAPNLAPVQRWGELKVIPILPPLETGDQTGQETDQRFSLEMRRALAEAAQSSAEGIRSPGILVLGGNLPESPWGNPDFARAAFDWLAAHPWIHVMDAQDLLAAKPNGTFELQGPPPGAAGSTGTSLDQIPSELEKAPPGPAAEAAWQAYLASFNPAYPNSPELPALRAYYAGQVGALLAAAKWAAEPASLSDCMQDPDGDGQPECILASEQVYALFESGPGALAYLFIRSQAGAHQVTGPSSQFASGMSNAENWDLGAGLAADPEVYLGAFSDDRGPYQAVFDDGALKLTSQSDGYTKVFSLLPDGLRAEIRAGEPLRLKIPLALDPWTRFSPGWEERYSGQLNGNTWSWAVSGGPMVQVNSTAPLSVQSFVDTLDKMDKVEDPNFEFPPGHFLPFPLSLVEVDAEGITTVEVRLKPNY